MTQYDDDLVMATEAEIIHICQRGGLTLPMADEMELWEIAAALGLHRIETWEERDNREIVETKEQYWEETGDERLERMAKVAEERKARALQRKEERAKAKR